MTSRHGPGDLGGRRPLTPAELEALLEGGTSGDAPLDRLVSAARAPGRPDELVGLDAALDAAFGAPPTPATRTRRALTRLGAVTAASKIVALSAVGAAAVGGVVVAGETGHLPGQHRHSKPAVTSSASAGPSSEGPTSPSASPTRSPSRRATSSRSSAPSDSATASSVPQLCRRWLALPSGSSDRDDPDYGVLIRVAGGRSSVTAYCLRLGGPSSGVPSPSDIVPSGPRSSIKNKIRSTTPSATRLRSGPVPPLHS